MWKKIRRRQYITFPFLFILYLSSILVRGWVKVDPFQIEWVYWALTHDFLAVCCFVEYRGIRRQQKKEGKDPWRL